jgi:hypothetical protein
MSRGKTKSEPIFPQPEKRENQNKRMLPNGKYLIIEVCNATTSPSCAYFNRALAASRAISAHCSSVNFSALAQDSLQPT